jgi:hypothetical protein
VPKNSGIQIALRISWVHHKSCAELVRCQGALRQTSQTETAIEM